VRKGRSPSTERPLAACLSATPTELFELLRHRERGRESHLTTALEDPLLTADERTLAY